MSENLYRSTQEVIQELKDLEEADEQLRAAYSTKVCIMRAKYKRLYARWECAQQTIQSLELEIAEIKH